MDLDHDYELTPDDWKEFELIEFILSVCLSYGCYLLLFLNSFSFVGSSSLYRDYGM